MTGECSLLWIGIHSIDLTNRADTYNHNKKKKEKKRKDLHEVVAV
jgi:hypothetical protein